MRNNAITVFLILMVMLLILPLFCLWVNAKEEKDTESPKSIDSAIFDGKSEAKSSIKSDEELIKEIYWKLEKSRQTGNPDRLFLYDQQYVDKYLGNDAELKKKYASEGFPAQPSIKYGDPRQVIIRGNKAAIFGSFQIRDLDWEMNAFSLIKNNTGEWKINREAIGQIQSSPASFFPHDRGSFAQFNYPWDKVLYAEVSTETINDDVFPWKMKVAYDETYLYVLLESSIELPAIGKEFKEPLAEQFRPNVPTLGVFLFEGEDFIKKGFLLAGNTSTTKAKFDKEGKATENRYYSEYNFAVTDLDNQYLLIGLASEAEDKEFIEFKPEQNALMLYIPLEVFGTLDKKHQPVRIKIEEQNSIKNFLPYEVIKFP